MLGQTVLDPSTRIQLENQLELKFPDPSQGMSWEILKNPFQEVFQVRLLEWSRETSTSLMLQASPRGRAPRRCGAQRRSARARAG